MSTMTIGELVGYVGLDTDDLERGANRGQRSVEELATSVLAQAKKIEREKMALQLDADASEAEREIGELSARLVELRQMDASPEVDADIRKAEASLTRLDARLAKIRAQRVEIDVQIHLDELRNAERDTNSFTGAASRALGAAQGFADGLAGMAGAAKAFSAVGLIPVLLGIVAALSATSGALGLLPAIAGTAVVGISALKVGMSGFGDAMKNVGDPEKFAKSLEKLSPAARETAMAVRDLVPQWTAMKNQVQDALFDNLAGVVKTLAKLYLPALGSAFTIVADAANGVAGSLTDVLSNGPGFTGMNQLIANGALIWKELLSAVTPLISAFVEIGAVGSGVLLGLVQGAGDAAWRFADLVTAARETGQLEAWIRGGVSAVGDLGAIVGNVGSVVASVFRAANQDGAGLLVTVRQITAGWAEWAASAEGQARIGEVLGALNEILQATSGVLGTILPIIADMVVWFAQLPAPVQQGIVAFVAWGALIGTLGGKVLALVGTLSKLGGAAGSVVSAAARWGILGSTAKAAAAITNGAVGSILAAMGRAAAGMMVRAVAMAAAWLVAMGPVGWIILGVVAIVAGAVALIVAYWDEIKVALVAVGQWFAELPAKVLAALTWLGSVISTGAAAAWNWLVTTAQQAIGTAIGSLLALPGNVAEALGYLAGLVYSGALAAWRFLSETLPVIIAQAIAWLVTLPGRVMGWLTSLGETIRAGATAAWNWLLTQTVLLGSQALAWVQALPGRVAAFLSALPGRVRASAESTWNGFKQSTMSLGQQALAWIQSLPGRIMGFFSNAGSWLVNAGQMIITGLWNGLKSMAQGVLNWIADLGNRVATGFRNAVGIRSPSKVFAGIGVYLGEGLIVGLREVGPSVIAEAQRLADQVSARAATATQAAVAQTGGASGRTDLSRAAEQILARIKSGGQVFEDLSWKGMPDLAAKYNDQILDMADARGLKGPAGVRQLLEQLAAQRTQQQQRPPVQVTVNNPQAERASDSLNREARTLASLGVI